jgi:hypothetical protein
MSDHIEPYARRLMRAHNDTKMLSETITIDRTRALEKSVKVKQ